MKSDFINLLVNKHVKVYTIDANQLSLKHNLKNKISTIMESIIFYVSNIIPYDMALIEMKKSIESKFGKKVLK